MNDGVRDMSDVFQDYGTTTLHPVAVLFWLCMAGIVLFSSRSRAVLGVVLVCIFMPYVQRLVVAGLDFSMLRLIMLVAWARILWRREYQGFSLGKIDVVFILWVASTAVIHSLRVGPRGMVWAMGSSFDALTVFFFVRLFVRRREEVFLLTRHLAWIVIVLGVFMLYEWVTLYNPFSIFGSTAGMPQIRDGDVRCRASFSHPILAGTFGAVLLPIFIAAMRGPRTGRKLFGSAILFATVIVIASGSTGPLIAWGVTILGWGLWLVRRHIRAMMLSVAGATLLVHLVREQPVWSLIGRVSRLTGGTGYHRYRLIDAFISNFSDWALIGTDDSAYWGWGLQDTTSQYVSEGITGGLLTLIIFIVLLHLCFSRLRLTRLDYERFEGPTSFWALLAWGFSVSLAADCVSFISIAYFGQMRPFFVLFLGLIPALAKFRRRVRQVAKSRPPRSRRLRPAPQVARPMA